MTPVLRLRLGEAEGIVVCLDVDDGYHLRDVLFDDASSQSSSEACDLVDDRLLDNEICSRETVITPAVAADLVRGIDRFPVVGALPPALVELREYLRTGS